MYYFMRQNLFQRLDIIEVVGHTEETSKHIWTAGERFSEQVPVQTLDLDPSYGKRMADFFDTTIPLMSERLVRSLRQLGIDNFDAYPMTLKRKDTGQTWKDYFAVNVVGRIAAVDMNRSLYRTMATGRPKFSKIALDPGAIGDAIFFRLALGPGLIVVHEKIKQDLSEKKFVALMFQKIEDYKGI